MKILESLAVSRRPRQSANAIALLVLTLEAVMIGSSLAGNATWKLDPISDDWNTAANWTPETVPGVGDIATFATSNTTDISVSAYTAVGGISFAGGASAFTFTAPPSYVIEIQNRGISNNSAAVQTFIGTVDDEGNSGAIAFTFSTSTAGTNTVFIAEARRASSGTPAM